MFRTPLGQVAGLLGIGWVAVLPLYGTILTAQIVAANFAALVAEVHTPRPVERGILALVALGSGVLADRAGAKPLALAGLGAMAAACFVCALAPTFLVFRVAELVLFAGAVVSAPAILAWSLTRIDAARRGALACVWTTLALLIGAFAVVFHSVLTEVLFEPFPVWRQDYGICGGLLAAALLAAVWIPQRAPPHARRAADVFDDSATGDPPARTEATAPTDRLGLVAAAVGFVLASAPDAAWRRIADVPTPIAVLTLVAMLATAATLFFVIDRIRPRRLCLASAAALALLGAVIAIWFETIAQLGPALLTPPAGIATVLTGTAYPYAMLRCGGERLGLAMGMLVAAYGLAAPVAAAAVETAAGFGSPLDVKPYGVLILLVAVAMAACALVVKGRTEA